MGRLDELYKKLLLAIIGKLYWAYILRKNKFIKNTAIILIPGNVNEDGLYAFQFVDKLIKQQRYDNAFFLISSKLDDRFLDRCKYENICYKKIYTIFEKALRQFYLLTDFDNRFYYASVDDLFRRNGNYLIGVKGLDRGEIFARGVYRISD